MRKVRGDNVIDHILSLTQKHEKWRGEECINLIPSENVTSHAVRSLLSSDFGHRYTSPDKFYCGTHLMDEIEEYGEELAREVFKSETADLRPLSGHIANLIFLASFTKPKDTILCVSPSDGGYPGISEKGLSGFLRLKTMNFPFSKEQMNIKTEETIDLISQAKPKVVIFGASRFLFPHPVRKIAEAANEVDATVAYDGSHVLGLIGGESFQDPLREGASVLFGSTHKTLFGPQGGIILAKKEYGEILNERVYPAFVDNAHWNRIAALALSLAEMKTFGKEYARQVVKNAQALAKALAERNLPVVCSNIGYTKSHQVFLDYGGYKRGRQVAEKLEKANIIVDCGVRLGACEVTRRGMKEDEMHRIADLVRKIVVDNEQPYLVKKEVVKLVNEFQEIKFTF
jgi:glycine hydroxymethyltransferase